jgi:RimJ/RimL family protein N-acetyltransferase
MTSSGSQTYSVRPMELGDIDVIAPWFNNLEDLSLFNRSSPVPSGRELLREHWKQDLTDSGGPTGAFWYMVNDSEGKPAAIGGLRSVNLIHGDGVLPVFVGRRYRGKGIGFRMIVFLLDLAFGRLRLERVTTYYREDNRISAHLLQRAAFKEEGRLRRAWFQGGSHFDMVVAGVLWQEWKERREELKDEIANGIMLEFGDI